MAGKDRRRLDAARATRQCSRRRASKRRAVPPCGENGSVLVNVLSCRRKTEEKEARKRKRGIFRQSSQRRMVFLKKPNPAMYLGKKAHCGVFLCHMATSKNSRRSNVRQKGMV